MVRTGVTLMALALAAGTAAAQDDKDDVAKAAKKTSGIESYSFKSTIEIEGIPMPMDPIEFEGKFQKDVATHVSGSIQGNDIEVYRKGEKVASKNQDGEWRLGGGRGGRGGGFGMGQVGRNLKAPHEELADIEKKFKELKKKDPKDGCTLYEGDLTDEAAKDMLPGGMGRMMGGMGEVSGSAKVFVNGDGLVAKYIFVTNVKASFNGQDFEITTTRAVELKDVGKTKVELPEEVAKLFEEKKDLPTEDPKKEEPKKEGEKKEY